MSYLCYLIRNYLWSGIVVVVIILFLFLFFRVSHVQVIKVASGEAVEVNNSPFQADLAVEAINPPDVYKQRLVGDFIGLQKELMDEISAPVTARFYSCLTK